MSDLEDKTKKYIISLRDRGLSGTSIYTYVKHIKVFLRYLFVNEYINHDISTKLCVKLPKTMPEVLKIDEIKRLFLLSNQRDRVIFMLLLDCGLRKGELIKLTIADISNDYVFVRSGKGGKDRVVPISKETYIEFNRYINNRPGDCSNAICSDDGSELSYYSLQSVFRRAKTRCDIPRLTAHLLRHTYASYFVFNGGDVSILSMLLGHSNLKITEKYLHLAGLIDLKKYSQFSAMHILNIS